MFKKLIILMVLVAVGYVGYLIWNNLTDKEKAVVKQQVGEVAEKTKDLAQSAADKLTGKTKELIHDHLMDDSKEESDSPDPPKD